jgi:hypothetical protein
MNLYQFVASNPIITNDPSGSSLLLDLMESTAIRLQLAASSFAATHPVAIQVAGGLLAAFDLYALMQYQEVQAIVVAQPNIVGALQGQAAATGIVLRNLLKRGTSIRAIGGLSKRSWHLVRAARAWVRARAFGKTGQVHHAISKRIWDALQAHPKLSGKYVYRDPRFVTQAIDKPAHWGYQTWHRELDDEIVDWVENRADASPDEFDAYLRGLYDRLELRALFPDGLP